MAEETLSVDVKIAYKYLDKSIGNHLEEAAKWALKIFESKRKKK